MVNKKGLLKTIDKFPDQKILVLGDLMLDRYLWSLVERISPEAPVPVAKVEKETLVPGGAANTAYNLASLDVKVEMIGLVGNDSAGQQLVKILADKKIGTSGVLVDNKRPTTLKTRIMAGNHQMIRFDYEDSKKIDPKLENELFLLIKKYLNGVSVLIISDYSKGLISDSLARQVIVLAKKNNIKVLVDPTPESFKKYKHSYLIKPNKKEAETITGETITPNYSNIKNVGKKMLNKLKTKVSFITLGAEGIAVNDSNNRFFRIPTSGRDVYDVSGAGDTTMAALAASLSTGANLETSAILANICAGIVVGKLGTAVCTRQELMDGVKKQL